jgi:ABC-type transport system involved in cytochrome c biogenesis ATPase subunit
MSIKKSNSLDTGTNIICGRLLFISIHNLAGLRSYSYDLSSDAIQKTGIGILLGPNGTGKTTILSLINHFCVILSSKYRQAGISYFTNPTMLGPGFPFFDHFTLIFSTIVPSNCYLVYNLELNKTSKLNIDQLPSLKNSDDEVKNRSLIYFSSLNLEKTFENAKSKINVMKSSSFSLRGYSFVVLPDSFFISANKLKRPKDRLRDESDLHSFSIDAGLDDWTESSLKRVLNPSRCSFNSFVSSANIGTARSELEIPSFLSHLSMAEPYTFLTILFESLFPANNRTNTNEDFFLDSYLTYEQFSNPDKYFEEIFKPKIIGKIIEKIDAFFRDYSAEGIKEKPLLVESLPITSENNEYRSLSYSNVIAKSIKLWETQKIEITKALLLISYITNGWIIEKVSGGSIKEHTFFEIVSFLKNKNKSSRFQKNDSLNPILKVCPPEGFVDLFFQIKICIDKDSASLLDFINNSKVSVKSASLFPDLNFLQSGTKNAFVANEASFLCRLSLIKESFERITSDLDYKIVFYEKKEDRSLTYFVWKKNFMSNTYVPFGPGNLSNGEQTLLDTLFSIASFNHNKTNLYLIDEPETSLHVYWQNKLLDEIKIIAGQSGNNCLITTHSPFISGSDNDLVAKVVPWDFKSK